MDLRPHFIRLGAAALVVALAVTACLMRGEPSARIVRDTWPVMGTVAALSFRGDPPDRDALRAAVQRTWAHVDSRLSAWDPQSELSRLAAAGCTDYVAAASADVKACYRAAFALAAQSHNAFNPRVGRRLRDLGVGDGTYAAVDLGAIAKGFAVDLAAAALPTNLSALVDLGGNLRVTGPVAWRTGIRNPFAREAVAAAFDLAPGESAATSGNYERFIEREGVRYSHILDGRTGEHVSGIAAVTVVTPPAYGAVLADGLSTTLFILGPRDGAAFLKEHYPLAAAVWIPDTPDAPRLVATAHFISRLEDALWPVEAAR